MQMAYLRERNEDGLLCEAGIGIKSVVITNGGTAAGAQEAGAASDARDTDVDAEQAETMGRGVFALRDFKAGDLILEESPLAFAPRDVLLSLPRFLLFSLSLISDTKCVVGQTLHCAQCLRKLAASTAAATCPHCRLDSYCSDRCSVRAVCAASAAMVRGADPKAHTGAQRRPGRVIIDCSARRPKRTPKQRGRPSGTSTPCAANRPAPTRS